jgi:hypothetical protein
MWASNEQNLARKGGLGTQSLVLACHCAPAEAAALTDAAFDKQVVVANEALLMRSADVLVCFKTSLLPCHQARRDGILACSTAPGCCLTSPAHSTNVGKPETWTAKREADAAVQGGAHRQVQKAAVKSRTVLFHSPLFVSWR